MLPVLTLLVLIFRDLWAYIKLVTRLICIKWCGNENWGKGTLGSDVTLLPDFGGKQIGPQLCHGALGKRRRADSPLLLGVVCLHRSSLGDSEAEERAPSTIPMARESLKVLPTWSFWNPHSG